MYWCGQFPSKYLPQHDRVFARIAREVPGCQFMFIEPGAGGSATNMRFRERLQRAFAAHGLDSASHCVFSGRMSPARFSAALSLSDVFLDSIGWSGCNTTLESTAHDLPIVTLPTPLMRGRHTLAILRQMGITETIADTVDDYIEIAVRLAHDTAWRELDRSQHRRAQAPSVSRPLHGQGAGELPPAGSPSTACLKCKRLAETRCKTGALSWFDKLTNGFEKTLPRTPPSC